VFSFFLKISKINIFNNENIFIMEFYFMTSKFFLAHKPSQLPIEARLPLTFTCVNSSAPTTIKLSISGELQLDNIYYRTKLNNANEYTEWTKYTIDEELKCTKLNDEIQFKNLDYTLSRNEKNFAYFSMPTRTDVLNFLVHYNQC
jgi:hypothetical protein